MDARLRGHGVDGRRMEIRLAKPVTVIGRAESCDIVLMQVDISRRHCEVSLGEGRVEVEDLKSSNGTYVNGKRIRRSVLSAGDKLAVGGIVLTVQVDGVSQKAIAERTTAQEAPGGGLGANSSGQPGGGPKEEADILASLAGSHEDEGAEEAAQALDAMSNLQKTRNKRGR